MILLSVSSFVLPLIQWIKLKTKGSNNCCPTGSVPDDNLRRRGNLNNPVNEMIIMIGLYGRSRDGLWKKSRWIMEEVEVELLCLRRSPQIDIMRLVVIEIKDENYHISTYDIINMIKVKFIISYQFLSVLYFFIPSYLRSVGIYLERTSNCRICCVFC